jgi:hypothetical protein
MTQNMKNTIKSLLGVKGGKAGKVEPNPATMQRPKSVSLDQAPECICGRSIVSLLNIKGGKGKTSTVQTVNVQTIKMPVVRLTTRGIVMEDQAPQCGCN